MAEMLADPKWIPAHSLMLAGFLSMLVGLFLFGRAVELPPQTRRWVRLAIIGSGLQAVEMVLHTAAVIDRANLVAGHPTPVLTTHLWLAVGVYPIFALTTIGFIIATARNHNLGSHWIGWLGIAGALGHGAAAPLTIVLEIPWAHLLFPLVILLALWLVLASVWSRRSRVHHRQSVHPVGA
jgi:hypothetical protein